MWKTVIRYGGQILGSSAVQRYVTPLLNYAKSKAPALAKGASAAAAMGVVASIFDFLKGNHHKIDTGNLRKIVTQSIPSVAWPSDDAQFIAALENYASASPSKRALVMQCLVDAGISVEVSPELIALWNSADPSNQDQMLITMFDTTVQSIVGDRNPRTATSARGYEEQMARIDLATRLAQILGGFDNAQLCQRGFLALEAGDWQLAIEHKRRHV